MILLRASFRPGPAGCSSCRLGRFPGLLAIAFAAALLEAPGAAAEQTFHLMQIEKVIAGVNGDLDAQAIQLRMRAPGQRFVSGTHLDVVDSTGANPATVASMHANVANGALGSRVLLCTPAFASLTSPPAVPDFFVTLPIPAGYLSAGSLTFEDDFGSFIWRLSWGGSSYTGPNNGFVANDPNGNYGPPFPGPLPHLAVESLTFQGGPSDQSSTNADDYAVEAAPLVFTNNAGDEFLLDAVTAAPAPSPTAAGAGFAPNPFRGATLLRVPDAAVRILTIRDVRGRAVRRASAGAGWTWDGRDDSGRSVPAGVYFYRMEVERGSAVSGRLVRIR